MATTPQHQINSQDTDNKTTDHRPLVHSSQQDRGYSLDGIVWHRMPRKEAVNLCNGLGGWIIGYVVDGVCRMRRGGLLIGVGRTIEAFEGVHRGDLVEVVS